MRLPRALVVAATLSPLSAAVAFAADTAPTFSKDVATIVSSTSAWPATALEIGPMPLTSFAEVCPWARAVLTATEIMNGYFEYTLDGQDLSRRTQN